MTDNRIKSAGPGVTLNWSDASSWSLGHVPSDAERVVADASSAPMVVNQPGAVTPKCRSINLSGYTKTLTHNANVTLFVGDSTGPDFGVALSFPAGTYSPTNATSQITFKSSAGSVQHVDFSTNNTGNVDFNDNQTGTTWVLDNPHTSLGTVVLQAGILDTNGKACNWVAFSSNNSNSRSLILRASSITLSGTGNVWDLGTAVGMTFDAGTSTLTFTGASPIIKGGSQIYNAVDIRGHGICQLYGSNTFEDLIRSAPSGFFDTELDLFAATQTITGTLSLTSEVPSDATAMFLVHSHLLGTQVTLDLDPAAPTPNLRNVTFQDIAITVGGDPPSPSISGVNIGDGQHNSGIDFTAPGTQFWVDGDGMWSQASHWADTAGGTGGTGRIPLPQDTVKFEDAAPSSNDDTVTVDMFRLGKDLDFSGLLHTVTLVFGPPERAMYGDLTLSSFVTMTFVGTGTQVFSLRGRGGTYTLTSDGASVGIPIYLPCPTGTYVLGDDFDGQALELDAGTFDAGSFDVTLAIGFKGYGTTLYDRSLLMGSNNLWRLLGSGLIWDITEAGSMALSKGTSTINAPSTAEKNFLGGGFSYHNIIVTGGTGSQLQNLSFDSLTVSGLG